MHHGEDGDLVPEQLLVEQGAITLDVTSLFERADAAQTRRRRNADPARQFDVGHAAVALQFFENLSINGVETGWHVRLRRLVSNIIIHLSPRAKLSCSDLCIVEDKWHSGLHILHSSREAIACAEHTSPFAPAHEVRWSPTPRSSSSVPAPPATRPPSMPPAPCCSRSSSRACNPAAR